MLTAMLAWLCALGILGLSATISCSQRFYYAKSAFRREEDCNVCFEKECMILDSARCEYYVEADTMLVNEDDEKEGVGNDRMMKEVDDLIFHLVDKASGLSDKMDCIPYVSRYTNCNKENVCLGCKTCSCNGDGKWNCSSALPCHSADAPLNIDHRVLVVVMETLMATEKASKTKRSITETPEKLSTTTTFEQLSEWLYGVKPLSMLDFSPTDIVPTDVTVTVKDTEATKTTEMPNTKTVSEIVSGFTSTEVTTKISNGSGDTDYVAFDEVLHSIAVDNKSDNQTVRPLQNELNNATFGLDYMLMDEDNETSDNVIDDFAYIVNFMQDHDMYKVSNKDEDIANAFENTNDIVDNNAMHIIKRDVSGITVPNVVPTISFIINTTNISNTTNTGTDANVDLKEDVLIPFNKIINEKKMELESLKRIKESLLKFVKSDGEQVEDIGKENITSNTYFSIYNLAMESGLGVELRRANPDGYDKYMLKLKSDILEVLRDVVRIQKHKNFEMPEDLKLLMHAMKRYVYKTKMNERPKKVIGSTRKPVKNLRRQMDYNSLQYARRQIEENFHRCDFISFKDCVVQVLEVIDKDMPKANALSPLSPSARKIVKSIIKSFYVEEFAVPGLRVHNPNYNLTDDLQSIGSKWQEMEATIVGSSPFVTLYRMKLLHFVLTTDVSKINDALALVNFAHSRRMHNTMVNIDDNILNQINAGLTAIHNKIQVIIRYYSQKQKPPVTISPRTIDKTTINPLKDAADKRQRKKNSFIKHIRNLLKTSKKDIAELLHRKVPKSEIVKHLAKKKLNEITERRYGEYAETMKRWQKNLDIAPRNKRSLEMFKNRIKNIIPNYLRHKVNPKIKQNKKKANATRKAENGKKKRNSLKRARRTTKPTTKKPNKRVSQKSTSITTKAPVTSVKPHLVTAKQ